MADPKWEETEEIADAPLFDETSDIVAPEEEGTLSKLASGAGESIVDAAISAGDTGAGALAAGTSGMLSELLDRTGLTKSAADRELEAKGFKIEDQRSLMDAYDASRGRHKAGLAEARERSPLASTAGMLAGNIGEGMTLGGAGKALGSAAIASKAGKASKLGEVLPAAASRLGILAKPAATAGIVGAESAIVEKAKGRSATEGFTTGATVGGLLGLAIPAGAAIGRGIRDIGRHTFSGGLGKRIGKLYTMGKEGVNPFDSKFKTKVAKDVLKTGDDFIEETTSTTQEIGKKLKINRDLVGDPKVDISGEFEKFSNKLDELRVDAPTKDMEESIDTLLERIEDLSSRNKNFTEIGSEQMDEIAKDIKNLTTDFQGISPISHKGIKAEAIEFSKNLSKTVDDVITTNLDRVTGPGSGDHYRELKKLYSDMTDIQKRIGIRTKRGVKFESTDIEKSAESFVDDLSKDTSLRNIAKEERLVKMLEDAGLGHRAASLRKNIDALAEDFDIYKLLYPTYQTGVGQVLKNVATGTVVQAGKVGKAFQKGVTDPINLVKQDIKNTALKIKDTAKDVTKFNKIVKATSKTLKDGTPDQLKSIAEMLKKSGKDRWAEMVSNISEQSDSMKRAVAIHSLMQQPAFKEWMKQELDN